MPVSKSNKTPPVSTCRCYFFILFLTSSHGNQLRQQFSFTKPFHETNITFTYRYYTSTTSSYLSLSTTKSNHGEERRQEEQEKNKTIQKINEVKVLTYKTLIGCLTLSRIFCLWQTPSGMKLLVVSMSMVTSFNEMVIC
jgi:hypothetical protein